MLAQSCCHTLGADPAIAVRDLLFHSRCLACWFVHRSCVGVREVSDLSVRVEHMYERLVRVRGQLGELVSAVDPDGVSGRTARELWAEFDRIERLGAAGKTLLARRIAASHQGDREGTRSAAESLARKAGTSTAAAKDAIDTSHRLADQPVAGPGGCGAVSCPTPQAASASAAPPRRTRRRSGGWWSWRRGCRWRSCGRNAPG